MYKNPRMVAVFEMLQLASAIIPHLKSFWNHASLNAISNSSWTSRCCLHALYIQCQPRFAVQRRILCKSAGGPNIMATESLSGIKDICAWKKCISLILIWFKCNACMFYWNNVNLIRLIIGWNLMFCCHRWSYPWLTSTSKITVCTSCLPPSDPSAVGDTPLTRRRRWSPGEQMPSFRNCLFRLRQN